MNSLETADVQPSLDDIQRFSRTDDQSSSYGGSNAEKLRATLAALKPKRRVIYSHGDHVELAVGDLKGLKGVITRVDGDKIELRPLSTDTELLTDVLAVHVSEIIKYFRVGNHVKVIAGHYEGETGMITKVEDHIASVMTDIAPREIKVLCQDLQESQDVAVGLQNLSGYSLHDLVQITNMQVGVIIKITRDAFRVIDQTGLVTTLKVTDLNRKLRSRDATQFDSQRNVIRVDDAVRILSSPTLTGKTGLIVHIWKNAVWIKCREASETHGITVTRANNLVLSGASNPQQASGGSALSGAPPMSPGTSLRAGISRPPLPSFNPNYRRGPGLNPLVGKTVKIIRGNWKGYIGLCKDINEKVARVELQATAKTVTVQRDDLKDFDVQNLRPRTTEGPFYDNTHAPGTPAAGFFPQTPSFVGTDYFAPNTPRSTGCSDWYSEQAEHVNTPSIPTPQDQPWTSSQGWTPAYSVVQTPSIAGYPKTPNYGTINTPTAHSPAFGAPTTPGIPTTPLMQTPFTPYQAPAAASLWLLEDIIVKINQGEFSGKLAVVKSFDPSGSAVRLELADTKQIISLPMSSFTAAPVNSKDKVIVLYGPERGSIGFVRSILHADAIVAFEGGKIISLKSQDLAPTTRS